MKQRRCLPLMLALTLLSSCTPAPSRPDPIPEPDPPATEVPATPVQVDWSKLQQTKGNAALPDHDGGRWYSETVTDLIPRPDYGPLYSYVGSLAQSIDRWTDSNGVEQTWLSEYPTPVYGLMTRDGKIVTDPVFQGVYQPTYRHGSQLIAHPVLLLSRAGEDWIDNEITNGQRYAVAAKDGSWCTDFEFWSYTLNSEALFLVGPAGVTWLDPISGSRQDWSWETLDISDDEISSLLGDLMWLYGFLWINEGVFLGLSDKDDWDNANARLFHPEDGSFTIISRVEWEALLDADLQSDWDQHKRWEFTLKEGQITISCVDEHYEFPAPAGMNMLHSVEVDNGLAILWDYSGSQSRTWLYRLSTGALLAQANYIGFIQDTYAPDAPKFIHILYDNGSQALYGPNFTPFLSYPAPHPDAQSLFIYQDGLIFARDDMTYFGCYDAQSGDCILYRNLIWGD